MAERPGDVRTAPGGENRFNIWFWAPSLAEQLDRLKARAVLPGYFADEIYKGRFTGEGLMVPAYAAVGGARLQSPEGLSPPGAFVSRRSRSW